MFKFLNKKTNTIEKSAIIISLFTVAGSILSVLRNSLLASYLGASKNIDIYYASFRIPDFIYNIFIMGAITAGFIPLLSKYKHIDDKEAHKFSNSIILGISFLNLILGLILFVFAAPIINHLFMGLDPISKSKVIFMTRIIMIQPIILGLSSIISDILLVYNIFIPFALAPLFYNLGIIFGIIYFYPRLGIVGLSYGVVLGALLSLIIQIIPLKHINFKFHFPDFSNLKKHSKEMFVYMVPRALSVINIQLFSFVISYFASFLIAGSLGIFNLANSFQEFPQTIFSSAIAIATFPILSKLFHQHDLETFKKTYLKSFYQILTFISFISSLFIVLRFSIVKILLNYGNFTLSATNQTANILNIMAFGLIFTSLILLNLDSLFALMDVYTPLIASFIAYGLGSFCIYLFYKPFGINGIAFSLILANFVYFLIMFLVLTFKLKISVLSVFVRFLKNLLIATLSGIIGTVYLSSIKSLEFKGLIIYSITNLVIPASLMFLTYVFLARLSGIEEINDFFKIILKKFKRN